MRKCKKCGDELDDGDFYPGRTICKQCHNKAHRKTEMTAKQWDNYKCKMRTRSDHVVRAIGDESDWEDACA